MQCMSRLGSGIPLHGRKAEMDRLRAAMEKVESSTATAVLLAGDAGVGKSRLVEELTTEATSRGAMVLTGHCLEAGEVALPYLPFTDALGQIGTEHTALIQARPALGRIMPELAPPRSTEAPPIEPALRERGPRVEQNIGQLQLFDAVLGLLGELSERYPLVLVIEDAHWADESTRHLLSFLVSRLRSQRLLMLISYRSDDLHRRHPLRPMLAELVRREAVERVDLGPLAGDATRAFVAALAEGSLPDVVIERVATRSEGNPFFAEELLAAYAESGGDELPSGLADVLLSRFEGLSPAAQDVVRQASVSGRRVRHARLQSVVGGSAAELDAALREAVQHHILVVDGDVYAFRHALLREAVYGDLLPGERVRIHGCYARQIATENGRGVAAALAHHYTESSALPEALAASLAASDEAEELGAPAEALRHRENALKLWNVVPVDKRPSDVDESKLLRTASYLSGTAGQPERSVVYARAALAAADGSDHSDAAAKGRLRLVQALCAADDPEDEAHGVAEQGWLSVADQPLSKTKVATMAAYANLLRHRDVPQSRRLTEQALSGAEKLGDAAAEANALTTLGLLDERDNRPADARARFTAAARRAASVNALNAELRARYFLALHHHERGSLREAKTVCMEGMTRASETGLRWSTYGLELLILRIANSYVMGDWDDSEEAAGAPGGPASDTIQARMAAATLHVMVGRGYLDEAERLYIQLREQWHRDSQVAAYCGIAGSELAGWRNRPDLGVSRVDDLLAWFARLGAPYAAVGLRLAAHGIAAHVALAAGNRQPEQHQSAADELLAHTDAVLKTTPRTGILGPDGLAWLAMAHAEYSRLGGAGDPAAWQAAVDAFDFGDVYHQAIARWRLAEALLAAQDRTAAAAELTAAACVAQRLRACPLTDAVTGLARRARLSIGESTPQLGDGPAPLTPRERSVLALVARGKTNREAGAELYISEKTVSVHLSRVMAKLGVTRRAEAVSAAYQRGLLEPE